MILTLRLDEESQAFFDGQRVSYFPADRNYLKAHLTMFHQLPNNDDTYAYLKQLNHPEFTITINGLRNLGAGVAYQVESPTLLQLHRQISAQFLHILIPQDKQPFKPHITIQNKATPEIAKKLLSVLNETFESFTAKAIGLDLWTYLSGPWQHEELFRFDTAIE